jgi:two-component system NarL family sensor kinase
VEEERDGIFQDLEQERSRLARELHAGAGQSLAAMKLNLDILDECLPPSAPPPAREALGRLSRLADSALSEVRAVSHLLHPPDWQLLTTVQALRRLLSEMGAEACFPETSIQLQDLPLEPDHSAKIALYRCAQECIGNVIRHSGATRLEVSLVSTGNAVELKVGDNGTGFDCSVQRSGGLGIAYLHSYASAIGGRCAIESSDTGTIITFTVPHASR